MYYISLRVFILNLSATSQIQQLISNYPLEKKEYFGVNRSFSNHIEQ